MAGGTFTGVGDGKVYEGHTTLFIVLSTLVAAMGGFIFGYDIGISGGVTSMDDFLLKFFPVVVANRPNKNNYCQYDNQKLQAFTSSLYLAGLTASFFASHTTRYWGRKPTMLIAGSSCLMGAILNAAAENIEMLIVGRIVLGVGIGFGNQAVPLYISEMAPAQFRGALNIMFQQATTTGILVANLINYGTGKETPWGWRLSLGLVAVPAVILAIGGLFLPDTPNSLLERGHEDEGRKVLEKIRGIKDVDREFNDILEATGKAKLIKHPWRNLFWKRYRPQLVMAIAIPFFQQVTGINAINFYAPVLFRTIGFGSNAALYSAVIVGVVFVLSTVVSVFTVDRLGRKFLFMFGGIQMFICQVSIAILLKEKLPLQGQMSKSVALAVVFIICIYEAGFGWSWGPLGWLVPSEIFPLEIRSAAQSITVSVNFLFTFAVGQSLLTMLCHLQYGTFLFFAGWVAIMTAFIALFLPETSKVPLEAVAQLWENHWFWKRVLFPDPVKTLP